MDWKTLSVQEKIQYLGEQLEKVKAGKEALDEYARLTRGWYDNALKRVKPAKSK